AYVGLALIGETKLDYAEAIDNFKKYLREFPDAERAALWMVDDYFSLKKTAEAESYFKSLIAAHAKSLAGHSGLGWLYVLLGHRADAVAELDRAIALSPHDPLTYSYKAYALLADGYYQQVLNSLQTCLRLLDVSPDEEEEKIALSQLGDLYRRMGNYADALKSLERVVTMALSAGDLHNAEVALSQIGSVHYHLSAYVKALEYWQQALEVSRTIVARKMKIRTHLQNHVGNMGDVYYQLGDLAMAEQTYLEAVRLSSEANDEANQSSVLKSLGDLYVEQGKLKQALPIFEKALALGEKLNDRGNQIGALLSLSALYRQFGEYQPAMDYAQRALKMLVGRSNPLWQSKSLNNLGLTYLRFNNLAQAEAAFAQALAIDPASTAPNAVWESHAGMAEVNEKLGQPGKAR